MNDLVPWFSRTSEEAALMNPAFMAVVLHYAARGFEQESAMGMPFPLAFLVPPVVLVESIRLLLPRRKDSSLAALLQKHPHARLHFADISISFVPLVREGLLFGVWKHVLSLIGDRVHADSLTRGSGAAIEGNTEEFQAIMKASIFVGKWYANAGSTETIMALWGVRP